VAGPARGQAILGHAVRSEAEVEGWTRPARPPDTTGGGPWAPSGSTASPLFASLLFAAAVALGILAGLSYGAGGR
jgi:hypothetical protein